MCVHVCALFLCCAPRLLNHAVYGLFSQLRAGGEERGGGVSVGERDGGEGGEKMQSRRDEATGGREREMVVAVHSNLDQ